MLPAVPDKQLLASTQAFPTALGKLSSDQSLLQITSPTQTISGRVTDEKGEGLPGVNITLKATTTGTATDVNGNYNLTVPNGSATLVFSFIGYLTEEVRINNQSVININLIPDMQALQEVVVVGYGEQKKITMTGSVSTISGDQIRQNPSASLQNTLAGRLPGFFSQQRSGRPGSDGADFYIRGQSSYNNNNQPLIIVDDVEFTYSQFARLDPNEIESISILKDAATTSIYGIKGANGVLVVTTRRGKIGPPQISFRTESSYMQPTRIPEFLDAYQTASLYNQAQINDNETNPSPTFKPRFTEEDLELYRTGADPYGHPNIDWKKTLFKDFSSQYRGNMDISGGTDRVKYFISVGYLWQDGMLKDYSKKQDINANYYHKRYNYRSNLDMNVTKSLDLRMDLYGNMGETNNPSLGSPWGYNDLFYEYSSFLTLSPFSYPIYNPDGSFGYSKWQRNEAGGGNYNANNVVGRMTYYGYNRDVENNINLVASAKQKLDFITKGLSLKATVSYASTYKYTRSMTRDQFPSFIHDPATNAYEPRDANIYRVRRFTLGYNAGSTTRNINVQAILDYDRTFGSHHLSGLLLLNQYSNTASINNPVYNFVPNNFRGYSSRLGYDYKQKYLFQVNMAYNGSDRFSKENRFGLFPAVSVGWNIAEEGFFKNVPFTNRLKLRGSYGLVGNDKLGNDFAYYYEQTYTRGNGVVGQNASFGYSHNGYSGVREGTLANQNVTWEKEKKLDVGIEVGLLRDKISATFDYFNNERYDIMTRRGTISSIFGQGLPPINLGKVNNRGYEMELIYREKLSKDFSFSVKGNYSFAKNKILYQDEPTPLFPYQAYTGNSIGQSRVYQFIGFYKDQDDIANSPKTSTVARPGDLKYADLNADGLINEFDMSVSGYPNLPNTTYGFQVEAKYKNISFSAMFQGAKNFNVRGAAEAIQAFSSNLMEVHTKAWTPELGDNARYPRLSMNPGVSSPGGYPSTFWFIAGDYLRLKTAELAYELPDSWVKALRMQNIRLYTNGYNLLTWSKLDKRYEFDPEITSGTDRINYPPQRMFNLGLSATF